MDVSKNTQIDLLYLTNKNFKLKYNDDPKLLNEDDIKFYRKRILQETKDYLRGNKINENIDKLFELYANELIKHYKFIDKKREIQKEYIGMSKKKEGKIPNIELIEENKKLMKKQQLVKKTIKDFIPIVVKERPKKKIIIPKKKNFDLKNPKNRKKQAFNKKEKSK